MKYLILLIMTMSVTILALKIEDNTNDNIDKSDKKEINKTSDTSTLSKGEVVARPTNGENKKNTQENKPINNKQTKKQYATIKKEDFIMPKAEDMGRVIVIPSLEFNSIFSGISSNFFIVSSDFEYNTGLIYNKLAIYGNLGLGGINNYFLMHLEAGSKYNFPRLTRFMKPFAKLGLALNPYFANKSVYLPSTFVVGVGFKFFITHDFAFEESQDFQLGKEISTGDFNMFLRFKLGLIFIF